MEETSFGTAIVGLLLGTMLLLLCSGALGWYFGQVETLQAKHHTVRQPQETLDQQIDRIAHVSGK